MKHKWDEANEHLNLASALAIIQDLLNTTELNMDDMEDHTRDSIRQSYEFLDEARSNGYIVGTTG
jgi:hypothetical protein